MEIKENERLNKLNHSCAHLLAQAVKHLYPEAKFWVGPVIEEGFYYDIDLGDAVIKEEDLAAIEKEMKKCAKAASNIVRHELTKEEALKMFHDDPYKLDLIERMDETYVASFQAALVIILLEGIVFVVLSIFNVREKIVEAIPLGIRLGISPAIGLMLMNIGLGSNVGVYAEGNGFTTPFYVMRDFFGALTPSYLQNNMGDTGFATMILT